MSLDALVAGGGLAGSAVAIRLAQSGRRVVLIERETQAHDKVCGEFLSFEACHYLDRLGIDLTTLKAESLDRVRLVRGARAVGAPLAFTAMSLSRRVLDEALLEQAIAYGVEVRRGVRVKALTLNSQGWDAALDTGETVTAPAAFSATGKHDLKDRKREGRQNDLIGFKMYWRLAPSEQRALNRHVELVLFPGGYAGLQPVDGGRANLCLLVRQSAFADLAHSWDRLLQRILETCPHLRQRLAGAEAALVKPLAISSLPYGYVFDGKSSHDPALWRVGDQAAVIPSFSGDGMSIALHSAERAASAYLAGLDASAYHAKLAHDLRPQITRATRLSQMLVSPWGQLAAQSAARLMPHVLTATAAWTRIPARALNQGLTVS